MAETLKTLRRRVRAISNMQQVTRAMKMVSASKLRRATLTLEAARPYATKLQELLARLAPSAETAHNPLFELREVRRTTLVLFTADRGLCGGFNNNVIRPAEEFLIERPRGTEELYCVGKKGYNYFRRKSWPIIGQIIDFSGRMDMERSNELADFLTQRFLQGETDEIFLLYNQFVSTAIQRPTQEKFLRLSRPSLMRNRDVEEDRALEYILEPSPQRVFDLLIPRYLRSKIHLTLAEHFTAEHAARMLAMNNATRNCEEMTEFLTLKLNKARQAAITKELLDIVGGAEALQG